MKRSLVSALASLLLAMDVRAAEPRWTVEFKEGAYTFLTATGLEVGQRTGPGAIAGYLVVRLPADVDPATTNRGVLLGRVRVPERRVTWLKGDEFTAGELLPAHHLIAITPNAGFEPGLWAVKVRDTVKDRNGRPINPTNATWTLEIGEPRARPDDSGPARNTLKLKFTTEVDPATYADGIVVERQVAGGWEEEPRGSATIAPSAHGGAVNEIGLRPLGGWERGATYRVRVTDAIRDVRGLPLTNAEDFSFTVPKSGPFETRHEPRRPVAQASAQAASAGPAFPGGQALGWHGHWTDPVTGLIYMRHRWYDPRTGTFLSPDPLEDIDSPNQYLFGAGRPHEVVDPLGLQSCNQCPLLFGAAQGNQESIGTLNALSMWGQYGPPTFTAAGVALGPMALGPLALEAAPLVSPAATALKARAGTAVLSGSLVTSILSSPGVVQRGGQVVAGLAVPGPSLSSEIPAAAKAGAAAATVTTIIPKSARALGKWGESRLAQVLNWAGSKPANPFPTSLGPRYVDRLVEGVAHEAKAGANVKLTQALETQVLKDVELIEVGQIKGAHWHFFQAVEKDVLDFLEMHGIKYTVHP